MLALILTIGVCFAVQLILMPPDLAGVLHGIVPRMDALAQPHAPYLAIGILGATVMPHNLYLHSAIARKVSPKPGEQGIRQAMRLATVDIGLSLLVATLINGGILVLAACAFHAHGQVVVADIEDAYRLLAPLTGGTLAALLFGVALLAAGQSATFTGTMAGQIVLEGFLDLTIPAWKRRLITRGLAIVPALASVLLMGDHAAPPRVDPGGAVAPAPFRDLSPDPFHQQHRPHGTVCQWDRDTPDRLWLMRGDRNCQWLAGGQLGGMSGALSSRVQGVPRYR